MDTKMSKEKKDFKDTKFGKFLNKAKDFAPELLNVAGKVATGNIGGAVAEVGGILKKKSETDNKAKQLLQEFEIYKMDFEKECFELESKDRDSARNREVEMAKSGKFDFMMLATGVVGLLAFMFIIYAIVYIPNMQENDLFVHLMGMVEGVVIGNIFAYYYGTSMDKK